MRYEPQKIPVLSHNFAEHVHIICIITDVLCGDDTCASARMMMIYWVMFCEVVFQIVF